MDLRNIFQGTLIEQGVADYHHNNPRAAIHDVARLIYFYSLSDLFNTAYRADTGHGRPLSLNQFGVVDAPAGVGKTELLKSIAEPINRGWSDMKGSRAIQRRGYLAQCEQAELPDEHHFNSPYFDHRISIVTDAAREDDSTEIGGWGRLTHDDKDAIMETLFTKSNVNRGHDVHNGAYTAELTTTATKARGTRQVRLRHGILFTSPSIYYEMKNQFDRKPTGLGSRFYMWEFRGMPINTKVTKEEFRAKSMRNPATSFGSSIELLARLVAAQWTPTLRFEELQSIELSPPAQAMISDYIFDTPIDTSGSFESGWLNRRNLRVWKSATNFAILRMLSEDRETKDKTSSEDVTRAIALEDYHHDFMFDDTADLAQMVAGRIVELFGPRTTAFTGKDLNGHGSLRKFQDHPDIIRYGNKRGRLSLFLDDIMRDLVWRGSFDVDNDHEKFSKQLFISRIRSTIH